MSFIQEKNSENTARENQFIFAAVMMMSVVFFGKKNTYLHYGAFLLIGPRPRVFVDSIDAARRFHSSAVSMHR